MASDDPLPVGPVPLEYAGGRSAARPTSGSVPLAYAAGRYSVAESIRQRGDEVDVAVTADGGLAAMTGHVAAAAAWAVGGVALGSVVLLGLNVPSPFAALSCTLVPTTFFCGLWLGWRQLRRFKAVGAVVLLRVSPGWVTLTDLRRTTRPTRWRRADVRSVEFERVGPATAGGVPVAIRVNVVRRRVRMPIVRNGPPSAGAGTVAGRVVGLTHTFEARAVVSDPKFVRRASEVIAAAIGPAVAD